MLSKTHLILSESHLPDLPGAWRWRITLDWEVPSSPDTLRVPLTGFAESMKVTNHTELWDANLAWYSPSATCRISREREGDESHLTERWQARLILSECYLPDLPGAWRGRTTLVCGMPISPDISECHLPDFQRAWRWRITLDCGMPISPDTLRVLLTGFVESVKVTNYTGLWDANLAWYSPSATYRICQEREGDDLHWTERFQAHLILSEGHLPDLLRARRWRTTLNCAMPNSPNTLRVLLTGFAGSVKVTNCTGLCDAKLAWYSPSAT